MKKIEAIIKPFKLEATRQALGEAGIDSMTVSEVRGLGRQNRHTEVFRGAEYPVEFLHKIKIELVLADHRLEGALTAIRTAMHASSLDDDKVFVSNIEDALRAPAPEMAAHAA
jgi:nitrogen regulatory protein PII